VTTVKQVVAASSPSRPVLEIEIRKSAPSKKNITDSQPEPDDGPSHSNDRKPKSKKSAESMPDSFRSPQSDRSNYLPADGHKNKSGRNKASQDRRDKSKKDDGRERVPESGKKSKPSDNAITSAEKKEFISGTVADELFNDEEKDQDSINGEEDANN